VKGHGKYEPKERDPVDRALQENKMARKRLGGPGKRGDMRGTKGQEKGVKDVQKMSSRWEGVKGFEFPVTTEGKAGRKENQNGELPS